MLPYQLQQHRQVLPKRVFQSCIYESKEALSHFFLTKETRYCLDSFSLMLPYQLQQQRLHHVQQQPQHHEQEEEEHHQSSPRKINEKTFPSYIIVDNFYDWFSALWPPLALLLYWSNGNDRNPIEVQTD